jgi:hypothetical protein
LGGCVPGHGPGCDLLRPNSKRPIWMQPNKMVGEEVSMTQSHDHTHYQENITSLLHDLHYVEKVTVHFHPWCSNEGEGGPWCQQNSINRTSSKRRRG